jgi:hypothetical protein
MIDGAESFRELCRAVALGRQPRVLTSSAAALPRNLFGASYPRLILASPPYPGVYALYHRWKVQSRRETPFPYWIADCRDGAGHAHYTLARPKPSGVDAYFKNLAKVYARLRHLAGPATRLVQVVGFSEPSGQLPRFLETMERVGFHELSTEAIANESDGRLWRHVPGRRWFALNRNTVATAREVLLVHRPA